jgi:hypothetical protein
MTMLEGKKREWRWRKSRRAKASLKKVQHILCGMVHLPERKNKARGVYVCYYNMTV